MECPKKTIDLPQATDKLYHIMLYTLPWAGFELTTLLVILVQTAYVVVPYDHDHYGHYGEGAFPIYKGYSIYRRACRWNGFLSLQIQFEIFNLQTEKYNRFTISAFK